jgi:type II secretory pathway pseudopilin PulG
MPSLEAGVKAMKALVVGFLGGFLAVSASLWAQDPGMMAAQQAQQAAMQANQAAIQANQQAMQAAQQANQQAMQDAQNAAQNNGPYTGPYVNMTRAPKFSVKAGRVDAGTLVRISSPTHYATIYYTTNGWTPTLTSKKYTGPVRIERNTILQAIAIAPSMNKSFVAQVEYSVPGSSAAPVPQLVSTDGVLRGGTKLQLATMAELDSSKAQVGDKMLLSLDQDITIADKVVIPKGTTVEADVTQADPPGHAGMPGDIAFEVKTLAANGISVPLTGGETMEGPQHVNRTRGLFLIPVVGAATLLARGDQAVIKPGMTFRVTVANDTPLTVAAASATR